MQGWSASRGGLHRGGGVCIGGRDWVDCPHWIIRDTVNERAVRIPLECILLLNYEGSFLSGFMDFQLGTFTADLGFVT